MLRKRTARALTLTVPVALGAISACTVALSWVVWRSERVSAQLDAVAAGHEQGLIVTTDELPRDAKGEVIAEGFPGVIPQREVPADAIEALRALEAARDRIVNTVADESTPDTIPALPGDEQGPPRMDSGDPDPDRSWTQSLLADVP